jgi:DNA (cytosine-5)-methyltransferase 1
MKNFRFVDLFCGGGGSITGAINALNAAGEKYDGRGFNHWEIAIRTIQNNHPEIVPDFRRACAPIQSLLPDEIFPDDPERLDVLWASPSCTHHSNAAGGKPRSNQLRSQPEYLLPYLRLTKCRRMYVENVKELENWGPILDDTITWKGKTYKAGQPDPRKKGKFFDLWLKEIKESGYKVDTAILNAADYGAATSRERLIIQAVRKSAGEKIIWPEPTHSRTPDLFACKPWRSAAEIIDWSIPGKSIFDREKPLCANTLRRIEAGIRKYWGAWAEPFLIILRGTDPGQLDSTAIPLTAPLPTITAGGEHVALISPFLTRYNGGEDRNHAIHDPIPVIDTGNRYGMISPVIMDMSHPGDPADAARCRGNSDPIGTITTRNNWSVFQPFISAYYSPGTNTGVKRPVPTITTMDKFDLITPFLAEYYGNGATHPVTAPVPVIPTHDRFGLVQGRILILPDGRRYKLDITHRMLTSKELAAATSFPENYIFAGKDTEIKKQIGNAVPPVLAEALYRAFLAA